jgi:hypothetical protein
MRESGAQRVRSLLARDKIMFGVPPQRSLGKTPDLLTRSEQRRAITSNTVYNYGQSSRQTFLSPICCAQEKQNALVRALFPYRAQRDEWCEAIRPCREKTSTHYGDEGQVRESM